MTAGTKPQAAGWAVNDEVRQLRIVGTDVVFDLTTATEWTIGTGPACSIRISDPTERASRNHGRVQLQGGWSFQDLGSTNGSRCDGEVRVSFQLTPGVHLGIGGITLVAESPRLQTLHAYLCRLLGWSAPARLIVDTAVHAVRDMAMRRAVLALAGSGNLLPLIRRLHELTVSTEHPLVVVDTVAAARAAAGTLSAGMLCIAATLPPRDIDDLVADAARSDIDTRIVIYGESLTNIPSRLAQSSKLAAIALPVISARPSGEIDRLLAEFAGDAVVALGVDGAGFREHELVWLRKLEYASVAELADTAFRVVALRNFGVTAGAARLGINHAALSRWAKRRHIPT